MTVQIRTNRSFTLQPVSVSDQRFPCSLVSEADFCHRRASFRITPACMHTEEDWPTAQACSAHLARVVSLAANRCKGHYRGERVMVRPL